MKKLLLALMIATLPVFAQGVTEQTNQLALNIYNQVSKTDGNLFFSPYSIYSNLSMVYAGAKGKTAEEIAAVLQFTGSSANLYSENHQWMERLITSASSDGYSLQIANGVFLNKGTPISNTFSKVATGDFNANVQAVNFGSPDSAIRTINDWFSIQTKGNIPSLLQSGDVDSSTRLLLASAIFFKGDWALPFDPKKTAPAPFHLSGDQTVEVPMMEKTATYSYFENDFAQGIWLPIQLGTKTQASPACVILLPRTSDLLDNLETSLDQDAVSHWMEVSKQQLVHLTLPKFCFAQKISLNDVLKALGMNLAFSKQADFSGINGRTDLSLTNVLHGAYVALNETGITAAAATASAIGLTAVPQKETPIEFNANRPFLFFIVDQNTESVLFMGKLSNPEMAKCP